MRFNRRHVRCVVTRMESIFDLPSHPLFVHFPIAFVPLVVVGVISTLARPAWRGPLGPFLVAGAVVSLAALVLARRSGEEMYELLDREPSIGKHQDLASQSVLLWLAFVVVLVAAVIVHRRGGAPAAASAARAGRIRAVATALVVASVALGVVSTVWIARTGHEGAKSHWSFVNDR